MLMLTGAERDRGRGDKGRERERGEETVHKNGTWQGERVLHSVSQWATFSANFINKNVESVGRKVSSKIYSYTHTHTH